MLSVFFRNTLIAFIVCFSIATQVAAQDYFEGTVIFRLKQAQGPETIMKYQSKGLKMRTEVSGSTGGTSIGIADYAENKVYVLMPQLRSYMETDISSQITNSVASNANKDVTIQETSEKETITGHACTKWIAQQENTINEIWVAKGIGKFFEPKGSASLLNDTWKEKISAEGGFPFKVIQKQKDGKEAFRMEVMKIDKASLDSALFSVPKDYKKFNVAGMKN
jgi:Domain of unknown function (DUF4412)